MSDIPPQRFCAMVIIDDNSGIVQGIFVSAGGLPTPATERRSGLAHTRDRAAHA